MEADAPSRDLPPRHHGDPAAEYRAARRECAVAVRSHRRRWVLEGRDPAAMLAGIVTSSVPAPLEEGSGPGRRGRAVYGATLTAKGRMVSDHRLLRLGGPEENAFLLDLPAEGSEGLREHLGRFLPPRFATVRDVSDVTGALSVVGPEAAGALAHALERCDIELDEATLGDLRRDEEMVLRLPAAGGAGDAGVSPESTVVHVVASGDLGVAEPGPALAPPPTLDVLGPAALVEGLREELVAEGCTPLGLAAWETLRVEGGVPAFGRDMDEGTIPVEAGIHERAIDYEKGCYTGQEVIVMIRDRGRVSRHLRGLLFGEVPTPPVGTDLHREDGGRSVGKVTSAVESPLFGQVAGLGYVRREVEPGGRVRVGGPEGPPARVVALDEGGWALEEVPPPGP